MLCSFAGIAATLALVFAQDASAELTRREFEATLETAKAHLAPLTASQGEDLAIFGLWNDNWVNANAKRWPPDFIITIYGGLARAPDMDSDALALAVCHELGHGYGGEPFKDAYNRISAEGQADYWAGASCIRGLLEALPDHATDRDTRDDPFLDETCGTSDRICKRSLRASARITRALAKLAGEPEPRFDRPDPHVAPKTWLDHPKTRQCRLDSFVAGILGKERPRCWFAPGSR